MIAKKNFVLVMSAAVDPNGMTGLSSPESLKNREQQYIDTLKFYVQCQAIEKILFVENSNWDLGRLKSAVNNSPKVTWLSLDLNNYPREYGKGYGEMLLMDRAAVFVRDEMKETLIYKVTGRFPILNIEKMIIEFSKREPLKFSIDILNNPLYRFTRIPAESSRTIIYAIDCDFYMQYVYQEYEHNRKKYTGAEPLMYEIWRRTRHIVGVYARFRHEPQLSGGGGGRNWHWWTANNYSGVLARIKRGIRQFLRWAIPWLWV